MAVPQPKRVVRRLLDELPDTSALVADVRIGLGYTAVMLDDGGLGLAYTFRDQAGGGCTVFHGLRPLASRPASALLPLAMSDDPIEAAVGLACANALTNRQASNEGDVLDQLELRGDDRVVMVGHFAPLVEPIRKRCRSFVVIERGAKATDGFLPSEESERALSDCDIAIITATALINHTADDLFAAARGCREVVLLGPSTPLLPHVFRDEPVTMLSGVVVNDAHEVLRVVSEGGGTRAFGKYVSKVSMRRR